MSLNYRLVKESFALIEPVAEQAMSYFYGRLFAETPHLRGMFPASLDLQHDRMYAALSRIVYGLDSPESLTSYLDRLGKAHRKYDVTADHYAPFGRALLSMVRVFAADMWDEELEVAWSEAYELVANTMMRAAEADAARAPAHWLGEVVEHDRRGADIAVLRVRTQQPLPHLAGQYVHVQTMHWPHVWRPFSVACAPRKDGELRLHVRAVPGGWVSGALVRRIQVGDQLMLGPAEGSLVYDKHSDQDMLCVAGGTGLAPIKAIVEQALRSKRRREIHLLFGVRHERDLYDIDELSRLESRHPGLRVVPVVSDHPRYPGVRGELPDVAASMRTWADHDVYVAGPIPMVRRTVQVLQDAGVPIDRIYHDVLDYPA